MELLQYTIDNGILDETQIAPDIEMKRREEKHKHHDDTFEQYLDKATQMGRGFV